MPEKLISVDEFIAARGLQKSGGRVVKAAKAPPSWNAEKRSADFMMSTQQEDRDTDIVFTAGIDTREFEKNPVALLFHKSRDFPIGTWGNLQKGATSLVGTLSFLPLGTLDEADKAAALVEAGVIRACSIGFIPKTIARRELENGHPSWGYEIRESELVECSIVPVPSNPGALVKSAGDDMVLAKELLEEVLDTYARTPEGLIVPRSEYEKAYRVVVEKISPPPAPPPVEEKTLFTRIAKVFGLTVKDASDPAAPPPPAPPAGPTPEELAQRAATLRTRMAKIRASQAGV